MRVAIREDLARIFHLDEVADRFLNGKSGFILDETPRLFGHVPAVMEAYARACEAFEARLSSDIHPWMTRDIKRKDYIGEVTDPVWQAIMAYSHTIKWQTGVNIGQMAVSDAEINALDALAQRYVGRNDLIQPNPDWNWHRSFAINILGQAYECTLVASPKNRREMSFILKNTFAEKHGGMLELHPHLDPRRGFTHREQMLINLTEAAIGTTKGFYKLRRKLKEMHSGEKYGQMDVFGTAMKLILGERLSPENFDDPVGAYVLSMDMFEIQMANDCLNALEYAAASAESPAELEVATQDPPLLAYHVLRGIVRLFKHVLLVGNDERGFLDGAMRELSLNSTAYEFQ